MAAKNVVVLDYEYTDAQSVQQALINSLQQVGISVTLSADRKTVMSADGLVVPGVGAFGTVIEQLDEVDGATLIDQRLARSLPVLGINVGFQVLFGSLSEDNQEGLEQWPGTVEKLQADSHDGWTQVRPQESSELFNGLEDQEFFFAHTHAVLNDPWENHSGPLKKPLVAWATHGLDFIAAVENGPLKATQFHPERSGEAGLQLLENWGKTL